MFNRKDRRGPVGGRNPALKIKRRSRPIHRKSSKVTPEYSRAYIEFMQLGRVR